MCVFGSVFVLLLSVLLLCCMTMTFDSDVHQPLSQVRMSLAGSLGSGQIIFFAGIDATDNEVRDLSRFNENLHIK